MNALSTGAGAGADPLSDLRNSKGKIYNDITTAAELLIRDGRLAGVMFFDEFAKFERKSVSLREAFGDICAPKEAGVLLDDDLLAVMAWLKREWHVNITLAEAASVVRRWSRATSINPVEDRLNALAESWDGVERLGSWLVDYLEADAPDDDMRLYLSEVGKRFLIGIVARAFQPGCQMHQMMILESSQGDGKSAAIRAIAHAISEDVYLDGFSLTADKDSLLQLRGVLLAEWSEMSGFGKKESETVKSFLTRGFDPYRDPYGRFSQKHLRTAVFFGSTNESF